MAVALVMVVLFSSPDFTHVYQTEVPCEADPEPFANLLIHKAMDEEGRQLIDPEAQLAYCFADGSPLR